MKIDNALKITNLMSIEATFKRGFSITRWADNYILTRAEAVKTGDVLTTELGDGSVTSRIV